jgi:DUF1680 family protein
MTVTARTADLTGGRPVVPSRGVLRPLGLHEARITGGFWAQRQQVNSQATLEHGREWMDKLGWTGNFAAEAGQGSVDRRGREFSDSEIYKLLEAMSWENGRRPDQARDEEIGELAAMIAGAQSADGYLHTAFGGPGQRPRYQDLAWGHELYCAGHFLQAAVARSRTGSDELLPIAMRLADHLCIEFGPDGRDAVCGHPEIEPALVELARLTGEQRYVDQAALFVARRGRKTLPPHAFGWSYFSDDIPVREARVMRGHAVRALYLAAGAIDVAVETGDDDLLETVAAQFDRTVARRTYLTGGMGSRHLDEAFGDDFVLPSDRAYSETCAGVAAIMVAWRLMLATGRESYADLIERILYNVIATAIGDDGKSFFYAHTLHQRTTTDVLPDDVEQLGFGGGPRAPWFEVSCCLANIARLLASLSTYFASVDAQGLRLHHFADAEIDTTLADGRRIGVRTRTGYPENGEIAVEVTATEGGVWTLALRVPGWAAGASVEVNGVPQEAGRDQVLVRREFAVGDRIVLRLPMAPRFVGPDPRIDAVRGCVAVERGPLVLCAESVGGVLDLDRLRVDTAIAPAESDTVVVTAHLAQLAERPWPYGAAKDNVPGQRHPVSVPLIPYHRWARSGPSTMRVWLPAA